VKDQAKSGRPLLAAILFGLTASLAAPVQAQTTADSGPIEIVPVRDGIYMLAGPQSNVTVQIGNGGVLVVDSMEEGMGEAVLAAIRTLSPAPIRYLLNTSALPGYTGGNAVIAMSGATIAGGNVAGAIEDSTSGAAVLAHENVLNRMSAMEPAPAFEGWPTSTYFTARKDIHFNGEPVELLHQAAAVTNGDSLVIFRRSDVIATGAIFSTVNYPFIDVENGGTFAGVLESLNNVIDMTVPELNQEGGTIVIPGSGRVCDESEVVEYRDMLTILRDYVQEMIKEGKSLQQVIKARPTEGFDARYGTGTEGWTTEKFVETIYRELSRKGRR
jgi:cyclase